MRSLHHHVKRLAARLMQIESASSIQQAQKAMRKAEKHQRKISYLHSLVQPMEDQLRKQQASQNTDWKAIAVALADDLEEYRPLRLKLDSLTAFDAAMDNEPLDRQGEGQ